MTRKRSASIGCIDRGDLRLVLAGERRSAVPREAALPAGNIPGTIPRTIPCPVIDLATERARIAKAQPDTANAHETAPRAPAAGKASSRPGARARPYVEALVGWLLIFGAAYLALLLIGP